MTLKTNARIAGSAFLLYIVAGISSMAVHRRAFGVGEIEAQLASIAHHASEIGTLVLLGFVQTFCAIVLGVTLWALTRGEDQDIAMLGMICRVIEGIIGSLAIPGTLALLWLSTSTQAPGTSTLAAYLVRGDVAYTATFFAVGSLAFAYLFLRGRLIPVALAWIGVIASIILVIALPLQLVGFIGNYFVIWIPMLLFEVPVGFWLMFKGVRQTT